MLASDRLEVHAQGDWLLDLAQILRRTGERFEQQPQGEPHLSHRLLTPTIQTAEVPSPHLILELHYIEGFGTLRDVRTQVSLLREADVPLLNVFELVEPIARLQVGLYARHLRHLELEER